MSINPQVEHYECGYDYHKGSPHLRHRHLYENLTGRISAAIEQSRNDESPPKVLEIGAGDGSVTERLLARGYAVTATELSTQSIDTMRRRFGANDRFAAVHDAGDLSALSGTRFDAVLFASVLHHIPDYVSALNKAAAVNLRRGGSLISIQDPLWYPRMDPQAKKFSDAAFLSWRLTQGDLLRGLNTRVRRRFRGFSEEAPGDAVEFHVVRDGVDELKISRNLDSSFDEVEILSYWSSQGTVQQRAGERLRMVNTFAVFATGYGGPP